MYAGKKKKYFHDSDPSKFFTNIASCWEKYDEIENCQDKKESNEHSTEKSNYLWYFAL